jgi:hypothetical protein
MSIEGTALRDRAAYPTLYLPSLETDMYSNMRSLLRRQDVMAKLLEISLKPKTSVRLGWNKYDSRIMEINNQVLRQIEQA